MKINEFIVAYAIRSYAYPHHAIANVKSYEDAESVASNLMIDDDDARVWVQVDNNWYCIWGRDASSGNLIVSANEIDRRASYVSNWY